MVWVVLIQLLDRKKDTKKHSLASDPHTSKEVLTLLADWEVDSVRERVAMNLNTPGDVLAKLSRDRNPRVRELVAASLEIPSSALAELAGDTYFYVLRNLARNPNANRETLEKLAQSENEQIRDWVAYNKSTPLDVLLRMYELCVKTDTLTEPLVIALIRREVLQEPTELSALIAFFGPGVARAVFENVGVDSRSVLGRQLKTFGYEDFGEERLVLDRT